MTPAPHRYLLPASAIGTLDDYFATGGGRGVERALSLGAEGTLAVLDRSGLRGRGGAGFPTAHKWRSVLEGGRGSRFVVANGAEGEPATFKDRTLIRHDPYRIVEGAAIAAFVVGAGTVYLATKRSYRREVEALTRAAVELTGSGILQDLSVNIVEGPGEYLYGEEKALLEVIEGRDPLPRVMPPYLVGLFATEPAGGWEAGSVAPTNRSAYNPTVVNNVETLASAAHILAEGAEWFRSMGTASSPGNLLVTIVGDVTRAGVHEVPMGTPLDEVLDACGGPLPGRRFKAALSGVSNPVLVARDFSTPLTYEHFAARGSGLGAAGFVVYDDSVNMTAVAYEISRFLSVESCGQCPPCKQGSMAITNHLADIVNGQAGDAVLGELQALLRSVTDANRCYLGTEEQAVVSSILRAFPEDVAELLEHPGAARRLVDVPLIDDIDEWGVATYDLSHRRKRSDWTYAPPDPGS
jgi:NADH-quinone oxidoreductase subunit F